MLHVVATATLEGLYCDSLCAGDAVTKVFALTFLLLLFTCFVSCANFAPHLPIFGGDNNAFVTCLTRLEKTCLIVPLLRGRLNGTGHTYSSFLVHIATSLNCFLHS